VLQEELPVAWGKNKGHIVGSRARKEAIMAKDRSPKKEVKKPKKAKAEVAKT
jgi:hypothetical protein